MMWSARSKVIKSSDRASGEGRPRGPDPATVGVLGREPLRGAFAGVVASSGGAERTAARARSLCRGALGILVLVAACESPAEVEEVASRQPAQPAKLSGPAPAVVGSAGAVATPYLRALSGRIYVPTYSHIYVDEGEPEDLAVTLSIRNVSTERSLVLNMVAYYDTSGKLIEDYLNADVVLGPLETVEYFVRVTDRRGGSGSNFIVSWRGDSPLVKPLTEAVMVRTRTGNQAYAFATRGIEIPDSAALPDNHPPPGSYGGSPSAAKGGDGPVGDGPVGDGGSPPAKSEAAPPNP